MRVVGRGDGVISLMGDIEEPRPGQYVSLILPEWGELPLTVYDYADGVLRLHISSRKLFETISGYKHISVKGPLGSPVKLKGRIAIVSVMELKEDFHYIMKVAKSLGHQVDQFELERGLPRDIQGYDTVFVGVKDYRDGLGLQRGWYVYSRWKGMNCMVGVCGECEVMGTLPCRYGPFIEVDVDADQG